MSQICLLTCNYVQDGHASCPGCADLLLQVPTSEDHTETSQCEFTLCLQIMTAFCQEWEAILGIKITVSKVRCPVFTSSLLSTVPALDPLKPRTTPAVSKPTFVGPCPGHSAQAHSVTPAQALWPVKMLPRCCPKHGHDHFVASCSAHASGFAAAVSMRTYLHVPIVSVAEELCNAFAR